MAKKKIPRFAIFFVEQTPPPKKKRVASLCPLVA